MRSNLAAADLPGNTKSIDNHAEPNRPKCLLQGSFYRAHAQQPWPTMRLAIRTGGNPLAIVSSLRALLQKMDPEIPLSGPRTMEEVMANGAISERTQAACLAAFSVLALILAAVGIYGLLAYVV